MGIYFFYQYLVRISENLTKKVYSTCIHVRRWHLWHPEEFDRKI